MCNENRYLDSRVHYKLRRKTSLYVLYAYLTFGLDLKEKNGKIQIKSIVSDLKFSRSSAKRYIDQLVNLEIISIVERNQNGIVYTVNNYPFELH